MIADRWERRGRVAARPVLVVGMAPSRAGHDLDGPTFERLAGYCGATLQQLADRMDLVNLLPSWPGAADSPKWDAAPGHASWEVGRRASLLLADVHERPRRLIVGLGDFVANALTDWWGLPPAPRLQRQDGPAGCQVVWSPHPAGTNMWWNDPEQRLLGEGFWHDAFEVSGSLPRAPQKVKLNLRTAWLLDIVNRLSLEGWPDECVDWPWAEPPGRPQAILRGNGVPAAHVVLEAVSGPRPTRAHQALHSCDRGEHCVNGAHLRWGLEIENRLDQSARARGDIGRVGLDKAREVRRELEGLSKKHGVPLDAIARIAGGRTWTDDKWETS